MLNLDSNGCVGSISGGFLGLDGSPSVGLEENNTEDMDGVQVGEEKKASIRRKLKLVETEMIGGDSDDEEPIGSLFQFKKLRNSKKMIPDLKEKVVIGVKNLKVEDEVSTGVLDMEDTLASFRKKLKAPKVKKDVSDVGKQSALKRVVDASKVDVGSRPDCSLNVISKDQSLAKVKRIIPDGATHAGENTRSKSGSKSKHLTSRSSTDLLHRIVRKSHSATPSKLTEESLACGGDGLNQSSDGCLEESLKARIRKSSCVSGTKAEESSKDYDSLDQPSGEISKALRTSVVRKTRSKRKQNQEMPVFDGNLDQHSIGYMDDSLSSLLQKSHSVSIQKKEISLVDGVLSQTSYGLPKDHISVPGRKVDSINWKQKEEVLTLDHGLDPNLDQLSKDSLPISLRKSFSASFLKHTEKTPKSDGRVNQVTDRILEVPLSVPGRKSCNVSFPKLTEECTRSNEHSNQPSDGISEDSLSVLFRKSRSVSIQRKLKETPISDDGLSQLSDGIKKDFSPGTVQNHIPSLNLEEIPRPLDDGVSTDFEGIPEESMPASVQRSNSCFTPHPSDEILKLKDDVFDRHSDGVPVDSLAILVDIESAVPITKPRGGTPDELSRVFIETPKTSISAMVPESSGSFPKLNGSGDGMLEDFLFQQVRKSSSALSQKISENGANQNCDGMHEEFKYGLDGPPENVSKDSPCLVLTTDNTSVQLLDETPHFLIQKLASDCVQMMTEESTRFDISKDQSCCSDSLILHKEGTWAEFDDDQLIGSPAMVLNFGSTTLSKQACNTTTCDPLPSQFSDGLSKDLTAQDQKLCSVSCSNQMKKTTRSNDDKQLKEYLSLLVQKSDSTSVPSQTDEILVPDDVFNQLPSGFSEDFQSVQAQPASVSMHTDEIPVHGDDGLKQSCDVAFGDSFPIPIQKSRPASIAMCTEEKNKFDGELNCQSDGNVEDFPLDVLQKSCFSSTVNHIEENLISNDGISHQSNGVLADVLRDKVKKSSFASALSHIEENPRSSSGLSNQSDGVLIDFPLDVVQKSFSASTSNRKEEFPLAGDVPNRSPSETLMDPLTLIHNPISDSNRKPTKAIVETYSALDNVSKDPTPMPISDSCVAVKCKETGGNSIDLDCRGICLNDEERASNPDKKTNKVAVTQWVTRNTKKRRHGDMVYKGDVDWGAVMPERFCFENNMVCDRDRPTRAKAKSDLLLNLLAEAEDGGAAAAVGAGLKACKPGPIEKIKFKDILKRRGGHQEYLECRNMVLDRWNKDVSRILPLSDCGVSDAPSEDEPSRVTLIREIYAFLDQNGYINVGIASEKGREKVDDMPQLKLSKEKNPKENCGIRIADSEEVAFILGQVRSPETVTEAAQNNADEKSISVLNSGVVGSNKPVFSSKVIDSSSLIESEEFDVAPIWPEVKASSISLHDKVQNGGLGSIFPLETIKTSYGEGRSDFRTTGMKGSRIDPLEGNDSTQCGSRACQRIIIVGAGPAGLFAARHLQRQGFSVCVLEARDRIGGRVHTDFSSLSVPVDLGASIITGVEADVATERQPDPSSLICTQLGLELTVLNSDCPLYDIVTGEKVPSDLDEALEAEYNSLLDDMVVLVDQKGEHAMKMSLEDGFEFALQRRRTGGSTTIAKDRNLDTSVDAISDDRVIDDTCENKEILSPLERRVMDWHFANLEYGCAAMLNMVSLPYWNQDDIYGGFGGAHCMIKGGYSTVIASLGKGLDIRLNHIVTEITYSTRVLKENGNWKTQIRVSTANGNEFVGDAVLITVPLGCLKANTIKFSPVLPDWKQSSIQRLGFGVLNKVVLEFSMVFWDDAMDYFGATAEETDRRGQCFMFWNVKKTVGAPVLIALVVGKAAIDGESLSSREHVDHAMVVLRKLFGKASVPDPLAFVVTNWGQDLFSRGAYSYVAIGASGEDYDILGRPVENCLFFAGEATCKEHPDTVGGAMMSGLREAVRIIDILKNGADYTAEVEAMEAAQRQSDNERNEVAEILKRLAAGELSGLLSKSSLGGEQMILSKEVLLQDMFSSAKTTAGRLHLVKELLQLPVGVLKPFMGTKEGLGTLNSWILDSMGKDGTQLLRHCIRLLVLVSTDLLAVRLSGIGRTVKEKVCVHTSRDIRAVASQLVSMWIEVFRKEKAANGSSKFLRQTATSELSKFKVKDFSSGKPPLRTTNDASYGRGNCQLPSSAGSHSPSNVNHKKSECKLVKLETGPEAKAEANSSRSHSAIQGMDSKVEDIIMSEEEATAFAAAEAARSAALAAAEAYASSEAEYSTLRELPKIPSFHKFARREQYAQRDDLDPWRRKWPVGVLGKQDCILEIDSRNCRVRNWSVDFSTTCGNLDGSKIMGDNNAQSSYSNDVACYLNLREHSGESGAADSKLSNPWFQSSSSFGGKDYSAIDRWQLHAEGVDIDLFDTSIHVTDEEDSAKITKESKSLSENQPRGVEQLKQAVVDYVASLLMPLYKARKIDKEGYKAILKRSATKVIDQSTEAEKAMTVSEFLEFKRKNKIRAFVDKLIERHMAMNPSSNH